VSSEKILGKAIGIIVRLTLAFTWPPKAELKVEIIWGRFRCMALLYFV
jgi:hypothetical protein